MPAFADFCSFIAEQNIDQMACTKPFFGAQYGRQRLAHSNGTIEYIDGVVT